MMRAILFFFLAMPALAAEPTTGVREQMSIGAGCETIAISNLAPTSVVISTKAAYTYVAVQNIDSTYDINCGSHTAISTTSTSGYYGFTVAHGSPGSTVVWVIAPSQNWWCMTQKTTATTRATTCRGR